MIVGYGRVLGLRRGSGVVDPPVWVAERLAEFNADWTLLGGLHRGALVIDETWPFVGLVYFGKVAQGVVELSNGVAPPDLGRGIVTRAVRLAAEWAL